MKIVVISDTHGQHDDLSLPGGDVLVHCGDFFMGRQADARALEALDDWFACLEYRFILCVGGNHDFVIESRQRRGERVFRNAIHLQDEAFSCGGIKFYGTPWVPELAGLAHFRGVESISRAWAGIPDDTDVLLTHSPPLGILDRNSKGKRCGCPGLAQRVAQLRLQAHCFGHVHASAGLQQDGETTFVNAAMVNSAYELVRQPVVLDIEPRRAG